MNAGLAARLDVLADAFDRRGVDVRMNLLPGATEDEIAEVESALDVTLPTSYRQLYGWSAGTRDESGVGPFLRFRDMYLLPLSRVVEERARQIDMYDELCDEVDFHDVVPLATFMGSTLAVVCGPQGLTTVAAHPVMCTFHDVSVYFDSIEAMIDTAIAWVTDPRYGERFRTPDELADWEDRELEIWRTHNRAVDFLY